MSERYEDVEHVLVVHEPENGIEVEHLPGCPTIILGTDLLGQPYTDYECLTGALIRDAGEDAIEWDGDRVEGRYRIKAYAVGPGWAGSYPIEPESGIEVIGDIP